MLKTNNVDKKPAVAAFGVNSVAELEKKKPSYFLKQDGLFDDARGFFASRVSKKISDNADIARLAKSFLTHLYKNKNIVAAGKDAREMIELAKSMGNGYDEEVIDWVDARMRLFANSAVALRAGMPPKNTIDSICGEVPHLLYSKHHLELENLQYKKEKALGHGKYDEALAYAQEGAVLALKTGNAWLAYGFELKAIHIRMSRCLATDDVEGAITNAAEAIGFAHSIGRKTPEWISEEFFIYAYRKNGTRGPAEVRNAVLAAIPDFPSNHVAKMEDLKQEILLLLDCVRAGHRYTNPKAAADKAHELLEFSFLAPDAAYFGNREWVRETFERYSETEVAAYEHHRLEELKSMLVERIADLYSY